MEDLFGIGLKKLLQRYMMLVKKFTIQLKKYNQVNI
jgi:hypothetical protein